MDRFSPQVIEELRSYVYRLVDPRSKKTFYVGRGEGNRVFEHAQGTIAESEDEHLPLRLETIREIVDGGHEVIHVIHRYGLSPKEAVEVEAAVIDAYDDLNGAPIGYHDFERGARTAQAIERHFAREEADVAHPVLFVNLARTRARRDPARTSALDAARFAWDIKIERAQRCEFVLGYRDGVVEGVFKPRHWLEASRENFPDFAEAPSYGRRGKLRVGFVGEEVTDAQILALYMNKRIPEIITRVPRPPAQYAGGA